MRLLAALILLSSPYVARATAPEDALIKSLQAENARLREAAHTVASTADTIKFSQDVNDQRAREAVKAAAKAAEDTARAGKLADDKATKDRAAEHSTNKNIQLGTWLSFLGTVILGILLTIREIFPPLFKFWSDDHVRKLNEAAEERTRKILAAVKEIPEKIEKAQAVGDWKDLR